MKKENYEENCDDFEENYDDLAFVKAPDITKKNPLFSAQAYYSLIKSDPDAVGYNDPYLYEKLKEATRFEDDDYNEDYDDYDDYDEDYDESLSVDYPEDFGEELEHEGETISLPPREETHKMPAKNNGKNRKARGKAIREADIIGQMKYWLDNVSFSEFSKAICKRVVGQKNVTTFLVSVYFYIKNIVEGNDISSNVILAAPSGSGKTETYRALRDYFKKHIPKLPVIQKDFTGITQEGYKGEDTRSIIEPLIKADMGGIGLVFMDEFDKRLIPSITGDGDNMNNAIQSQILTLIEGCVRDGIDTSKTMFIGMGSFDACRKKKETVPKGIGYIVKMEGATNHYADITLNDALSLGAIPELLGRFTTIINYYELSCGAVERIINMNVKKVSKVFGTKVRISRKFKEYLHSKAYTEFGCRYIYNILYEETSRLVEELLMNDKNPEDNVICLDAAGRGHIESCPEDVVPVKVKNEEN
jgi:hypothetical protein